MVLRSMNRHDFDRHINMMHRLHTSLYMPYTSLCQYLPMPLAPLCPLHPYAPCTLPIPCTLRPQLFCFCLTPFERRRARADETANSRRDGKHRSLLARQTHETQVHRNTRHKWRWRHRHKSATKTHVPPPTLCLPTFMGRGVGKTRCREDMSARLPGMRARGEVHGKREGAREGRSM